MWAGLKCARSRANPGGQACITLGDLFLVTGAVADVRVSEAPAPGQKTALVTRQVAAIARDNGIDWTPGASTAITVGRAGDLIPRTLILSSLADALSLLTGRNLAPEISNSGLALFVSKGAGTALALENLDFDPDRGDFSAVLIAPAGDPSAVRVELRGRAYEVIEVPVLVRAVAVGDVIAGADIGWINMRVDRLRSNMITEYALLEGQSPKRPLRVNDPVRNTDVQRPVVIAKGATILMVVRSPGDCADSRGPRPERRGHGRDGPGREYPDPQDCGGDRRWPRTGSHLAA